MSMFGNGGNPAIYGPELIPELWYFVTATNDGIAMRLYVDGNQVASGDAIELEESATPIQWGRWPGGTENCQGLYLDEISLYSRAMTSEEVGLLHSQGVTMNEPTLVGYWRNQDSTDGVISDETGNGRAELVNNAQIVLGQCPQNR